MHIFLLLVVLSDGMLPTPDPIAFERIRTLAPKQSYRTAEFEWTMSAHEDINDGLVERFRTHVVGESILQSNFGDERGFHEYELSGHIPDGATKEQIERATHPRVKSAGTRNALRHEGLVWDLPLAHKPVVGTVGRDGFLQLPNPVDPFVAGLSPAWETRSSNRLNAPIPTYDGLEQAELRAGRDGAYRTVTAEHQDKRWTWWLDDRRGGQPTRAMMEQRLSKVYSNTELMEVDGVWMPKTIRYYRGDDPAPYRVLKVEKASFDQPWHRQALSPVDLGARYGTQFNDYAITDFGDEDSFKFWDGDGLIGNDDFWMAFHGFGVLFDDAVLAGRAEGSGVSKEEYLRRLTEEEHVERARAFYRTKYVERYREEPPWIVPAKVKVNDEWDVYVEEFIKKHDMSKEAADRAGKILEEAKRLRNANRFRLKNAEREKDRRLIDRYKEREELIYKERLTVPLEDLAKSEAAKKEEATPPEGQ